MPKNKGKGGKSYKSGKKYNDNTKRELLTKSDGLDYGIITSVLGGAKVQVQVFGDDLPKLGYIRGPIYKREWLMKDDIVLVSLRDFEQSKCDIVWKYKPDEINQLQKMGEIPTESFSREDSTFDFIEFDNSHSENGTNNEMIDDEFIDNI